MNSLPLCPPKYSVSKISPKVLMELVEIYHKRWKILLLFALGPIQSSSARYWNQTFNTACPNFFTHEWTSNVEKFTGHEKWIVGKRFNYCDSIAKKFIWKWLINIYVYMHINTCMCVSVSTFIHSFIRVLPYGRTIASYKASSHTMQSRVSSFNFQ